MPNYNQLLNDAHRLLSKRQYAPAEKLLREVLALRPRNTDALVGLGLVCNATDRPSEAIELLRHALEMKPYLVDAHLNLGSALSALGKYDEAIPCFRQALILKPDHALTHHNLGIALRKIGQLDEAVEAAKKATELLPNYADAHLNLGNALRRKKRIDEAAAAYREAARLNPADVAAHLRLADLLRENFRFDEAVLAYRQAIALSTTPNHALAALATCLRELGRAEESLPVFRCHLERDPKDSRTHSGMLFALDYLSGESPVALQTLLEEHQLWGRRHADPLAPSTPPSFSNDRSFDRRLRVGYISPDFREHSVSFFIENLLQSHDPTQVEIFCYAHVPRPDAVTARIQTHAQHWRDITSQTHEETADQIRADQIDILVDLAGHSGDNRLLVLARRPAPIQMSYLGYVETTGVTQIDYRIADLHTNPPGMSDRFVVEKILPLPETFACYRPPENAPEVAPLPAVANGHVTFACLGVAAKAGESQLQTWAKLLTRLPASRLLFAGPAYGNASIQDRIHELFAESDISSDRLEFVGWQPLADYLEMHHRIDILLDMFPINGHTITCHAAWMGVPTVSQAGIRYASRLGTSVLANLGLNELLASTAEEYIDIAVSLANDLSRLTALRACMRDRLRASPIMDAPRFTRHLESAYRACWRQWCEKP